MITQFLSPYSDGIRYVYQFFPHSRELWILTKENNRLTDRAENKLGDQFESVLASFSKIAADGGWEKSEHATD